MVSDRGLGEESSLPISFTDLPSESNCSTSSCLGVRAGMFLLLGAGASFLEDCISPWAISSASWVPWVSRNRCTRYGPSSVSTVRLLTLTHRLSPERVLMRISKAETGRWARARCMTEQPWAQKGPPSSRSPMTAS